MTERRFIPRHSLPPTLFPPSYSTRVHHVLPQMFEELADYRAFELLRSHSARSDYLLTKQVFDMLPDLVAPYILTSVCEDVIVYLVPASSCAPRPYVVSIRFVHVTMFCVGLRLSPPMVENKGFIHLVLFTHRVTEMNRRSMYLVELFSGNCESVARAQHSSSCF